MIFGGSISCGAFGVCQAEHIILQRRPHSRGHRVRSVPDSTLRRGLSRTLRGEGFGESVGENDQHDKHQHFRHGRHDLLHLALAFRLESHSLAVRFVASAMIANSGGTITGTPKPIDQNHPLVPSKNRTSRTFARIAITRRCSRHFIASSSTRGACGLTTSPSPWPSDARPNTSSCVR